VAKRSSDRSNALAVQVARVLRAGVALADEPKHLVVLIVFVLHCTTNTPSYFEINDSSNFHSAT